MTAPIEADDIVAAIKKCKHGKAAGPDELGDSFYKDHFDKIAPILAELQTRWITCGIAPCLFGKATIYCLMKSVASLRPLGHRPTALLQSMINVHQNSRDTITTDSSYTGRLS